MKTLNILNIVNTLNKLSVLDILDFLAFDKRNLSLPDIQKRYVGPESPYAKFDLGIWYKEGFIKVYSEEKGISPLTIKEVEMA